MRIMVVMLIAWLSGCAMSNSVTADGNAIASHAPDVYANNPAPEATFDEESDEICLKSEMFQVEMCYGRGEARLDPATGRVVGYKMKLTHIDANTR